MNTPVQVKLGDKPGAAGRRDRVSPLALLALLALLAGAAVAQDTPLDGARLDPGDFTLFGTVDAQTGLADSPDRGARSARVAGSEPEFTLVGTSRIGDDYRAILRHRDGSQVSVAASPGADARIEGYSGYAVVSIASGLVSLRLPGGTPCVADQARGVTCNDANVASLSLTQAPPVPRPVEPALQRPQSAAADEEVIVSQEVTEAPPNPFAALRDRAQAGAQPQASAPGGPRRGFTPRRIDPAEVPPGMRIVSTPFGDRLVEDD